MGTYTGTPRTWVAAETVTAALMNSDVRDPLTALSAAWTSYTPSVSGFTLGNGTVAGAWRRFGKTVEFRASFTFGSTSAAAASYCGFSLPATAVSTDLFLAQGYVTDASGPTFSSFARPVSTTVVGLFMMGGTNGQLANFSTTAPFTWTTSDRLLVAGEFETA